MSRNVEVIMVPEDSVIHPRPEYREEGVEVPSDRLSPETLRSLIAEFVSREWEDLGGTSYTLEDKIRQVQQQLVAKKVKVVFDLTTETCNIVPTERSGHY